MSNTTHRGIWQTMSKLATTAPENPTVLAAALVLTGLAASMVLARETTPMIRAETMEVSGRLYPPGVFRSPHPALIAPW